LVTHKNWSKTVLAHRYVEGYKEAVTAVHDTLVTNDTDCADEVKLRSEVGLAVMVMLQKVAEN